MAQAGKTGTFENEKEAIAQKSSEKDGWHPVNVQYVADLMNNAYQNADERISYQRDFEIHEENGKDFEFLIQEKCAFFRKVWISFLKKVRWNLDFHSKFFRKMF